MLEEVDFFADNKILIKQSKNSAPTLPQNDSLEQQEKRRFETAMARTNYNYMTTYIEGVPVSADLPKGEEYDPAYRARVVEIAQEIADNFKNVVIALAKQQLADNFPNMELISKTKLAYENLKNDFNIFNFKKEASNLDKFTDSLSELFKSLEGLGNFPKDIEKMISGTTNLLAGFNKEGTTAFLKNSMHEMLASEPGRNYRHAKSIQDYEMQFTSLRKPLLLTIEKQEWMKGDSAKGEELPCMQDWFFGYLQTAGFNTTNLRGVFAELPEGHLAVLLSDLQKKFPITDAIFQSVIGDKSKTLQQAALEHRLYVVDYAKHHKAKVDKVFGEQRYLGAPIALFYWNSNPPEGYPPVNGSQGANAGVLQPIAIQLEQNYDSELCPIFTPNDAANANDPKGLKWQLAKFFVNVAGAVDHESVAHLGDCHIVPEAMAVATNRQFSSNHPIYKLLKPHFQFMININTDARHSLIVPGGVVATNVGPAIEVTLGILGKSRQEWRWDENNPKRIFKEKGLDKLPEFPFRDDTMLLWNSIEKFVGQYLKIYYTSYNDLINDNELQAWINELVSPKYADFKGLNGLKKTDKPTLPYLIDDIEYLTQIVSQIIYIVGPQHASVGYAQYPLMSYMPCVAGTIYQPPPTRKTELNSKEDMIKWYPPLDVALYTFSFEYLLSEIQSDRLGHYRKNPRESYFQDSRVDAIESEFIDNLALAEIEIRKRNKLRPVPYELQIPSQVPNSVCI